MSRWIPVVSLLALGCPSSGDDGPVTRDTDTDIDCRGCDIDSDLGLSTDLPVDTDDDETGDTSAGNLIDTYPGCLFGEIADCNDVCFPEWMLGDGFCDDGSRLPADFDCPIFGYDKGDCAGDTDVHDETDTEMLCGRHRLEFHTAAYAYEMRWSIVRVSDGKEMYRTDFGDYTTDYAVYVHENLYLPAGTYELVGHDYFGDGWGTSYWSLINDITHMAVARGGYPDTPLDRNSGGYTRSWRFDTTCNPTACDVDVFSIGGTHADEMAWELYTNADKLVAQRSAGTVPDGGVVVDTLRLYEGTYSLRTRDLGGDGWTGGHTEVRYDGGFLIRADGLYTGANGNGRFSVNCSLASNPAFDAPGDPLVLSSCKDVRFVVAEFGDAPQEIAWTLLRASDWRQLWTRPSGHYAAPTGVPDPRPPMVDLINLESGLYHLRLGDSGANGWQNARLRIEDPNGTVLLTALLPGGADGGRYFEVVCPDPTEDTDAPIDTDPEPQDCLPGAQRDCNEVCMPRALVGDGFCDDGVNSSAHFACADFAFDGGDCSQPTE